MQYPPTISSVLCCVVKSKVCVHALRHSCFSWWYTHYSARLNSGFLSVYRRTPISADNTFQDLPRLRETVDNIKRCI